MHVASRRLRVLAVLLCLVVMGACAVDDTDDSGAPAADESSDDASSDGDGGDEDGGDEPAAVDDSGDAVQGGSITFGLESETPGWLPGTHLMTNYPGQTVANTFYDSLTKRNEDGEVQPHLAESLEPNDDLTEWTLTLRPDVTFHDGTPLNAEALKANFDDHLMAETSNLLGSLRYVEGMEVVDDLTVLYTLSQPDAAFPDVLTGPAGWPFSPTAVEEMGADEYGSNPVGTGPFRFVSWLRDGELVVERNEDYWQDGLPYLDEITFRVITDEESRIASLQSGDVDAMQTLRQSAVRQVQALDGFESHDFIGNLAGGQLFNTEVPPLDDVRVRRSLMYAIDQTAILDILGGSDISPLATQWYSPDSPWYSEAVAEVWPTNDPAQSEALLQEYVDDPERSDGKAPGEPVSLDHNIIPDPSVVEMGLGYKSMWEAVGFEHNMNQVEVAVIIDTNESGDFMINTSRFGNEDDPCITLRNAFGDPATTPTNYSNFSTPELQENLETLCSTTEFDTRYEAVENIMMILAENVPHTWTGHTPTTVGARPELRNISGWTFPDGTLGNGHPMTVVVWSHVWLEQ
ncbi:MAG: ABC transporter substrate-binding protein [Actinomycetota bacterium]|nr:ABC transporter substrate-binding protein [Actinomycetota bacterium]